MFYRTKNANPQQQQSRQWVNIFVKQKFGIKSYLQYTGESLHYISSGIFDHTNRNTEFIPRYCPDTSCNTIDRHYFMILMRSMFCLCPAGDQPWSMRFCEAIMCKCIPIVKYRWETYRSEAESKLDYKFYYADDPEFIYRKDWVEHNYNLFLRYHTLK